jgi:hypothetical protein
MPQLRQLPRPVMRTATRFHCDKARWLRCKEIQKLGPGQLSTENHLPRRIRAVCMENILRDIQTDCGNLFHGRLLLVIWN